MGQGGGELLHGRCWMGAHLVAGWVPLVGLLLCGEVSCFDSLSLHSRTLRSSRLKPPCSALRLQLNPGGKYAFVEFSDMMDCTCALAMDGIPFMGQPLNIKRPSSYQRPYGVGALTAAAPWD